MDQLKQKDDNEKTLIECPQCGYSLRGLPAEYACPECGLKYDRYSRCWRGSPSVRQIAFILIGHIGLITQIILPGASWQHRCFYLALMLVGDSVLAMILIRRFQRGDLIAIVPEGIRFRLVTGVNSMIFWSNVARIVPRPSGNGITLALKKEKRYVDYVSGVLTKDRVDEIVTIANDVYLKQDS